MPKTVTFIRGYPGSGKDADARRLAKQQEGTVVYSIDNFIQEPPEHENIFSSLEAYRAGVAMQENILRAIEEDCPHIIVATIAPEAWECRDICEAAVKAGYNVEFRTPSAPWANNPEQCALRTKHNLGASQWVWLVETFEYPKNVDDVLGSKTPTEKLEFVKSLACVADQSPEHSTRIISFLNRCYSREMNLLIESGMFGPDGPKQRLAFQMAQKSKGVPLPVVERLAPPPLVPQHTLHDALQAKLAEVKGRQQEKEPPRETIGGP